MWCFKIESVKDFTIVVKLITEFSRSAYYKLKTNSLHKVILAINFEERIKKFLFFTEYSKLTSLSGVYRLAYLEDVTINFTLSFFRLVLELILTYIFGK